MPTKNKDITVQETNDSSILSKASIVNLGYFNDPFLHLFTARPVRRSPLIHRGYYVRAKAVDYILKRFIEAPIATERRQIISLGTGFDSSYFRLKSQNSLKNTLFYEIDFPEVIQRKINIIGKQNQLKNLIGPYKIENDCLTSEDYFIIPCDLTARNILKNYFDFLKIDFKLPTLFISECVLTYVDYDQCTDLLRWIDNNFQHFLLSIYEQIQPDDSFGKVMINHFKKIQSPLKRIHKLPTIPCYKEYLTGIGFNDHLGLDMNYFYNNYIPLDEREAIKTLEAFDEFEEFHLKCSHYCLMNAFKGNTACFKRLGQIQIVPYSSNSSVHRPQFLGKYGTKNLCIWTLTETSDLVDCRDSFFPVKQLFHSKQFLDSLPVTLFPKGLHLQRYGHACCCISKNVHLISGGFGVTSTNAHEKVANGVILNLGRDKITLSEVNLNMRVMYHTTIPISEQMFFIFGGRVSPKKPCLDYGVWKVDNDSVRCIDKSRLDDNLCHPKPRWRHAAAHCHGKIYVFGGQDVDESTLSDLWSYDLNERQWNRENLSIDIPARHSHTMNLWKDSLVVYGGLNSKMEVMNDCYQIQLVALEIQGRRGLICKRIDILDEPLPHRYSHTSHVADNTLVAVGGVNPYHQDDCHVIAISLTDRIWKGFHLPLTALDDPVMLHNHCSILQDSERITVVGGGGNCFSFGTHFNKYPISIALEGLTLD